MNRDLNQGALHFLPQLGVSNLNSWSTSGWPAFILESTNILVIFIYRIIPWQSLQDMKCNFHQSKHQNLIAAILDLNPWLSEPRDCFPLMSWGGCLSTSMEAFVAPGHDALFIPASLWTKWTWAALDVLHTGRAPCWTEALDYTSFCLNVSLWLLLLVVLWRPLHNLGQKHRKVCWPQQIPLPLFHQNQPTAICLDPASWLMKGLPSCPLKPSPSFFWSTQALPWPMPDWMTC